MKKWVHALLIFLFSFQTMALENGANIALTFEAPNFFITHEQFMNLTNAEQKTYVKKVREMVVEMSQTFPYFKEEMTARSSLFQYFLNMTIPEATGAEGEEIHSDDVIAYAVKRSLQNAMGYNKVVRAAKNSPNLSDEERWQIAEKHRQSMYWTAVAATQAFDIDDPGHQKFNLEEVVKPASVRVLELDNKVRSIAPNSDIDYVREEILMPALADKAEVTGSFPAPGLTRFGHKLEKPKKTTLLESTKEEKPPEQKLPDPVPPAPQAEPKDPKLPEVTVPEVGPPATAKDPKLPNVNTPDIPGVTKMKPGTKPAEKPKANAHEYRCMYAGFVIEKDPCMATRNLPWDLQGLDEKTFACGKGTVMCNPFVFGFKAKCDWTKATAMGTVDKCLEAAKPYCITPGMNASKNCMDLSNNESSLQAAVELIKKNKDAFHTFGASFADLCYKKSINFNSYPRKRTPHNKAKTIKDIERTCKVAEQRMHVIELKYGLATGKDRYAPKELTGKDLLTSDKKAPPAKKNPAPAKGKQ